MHSIRLQVGIRAETVQTVYDALARLEGITGWWTRYTDGAADKVGEEFRLTFDSVETRFKVEELIPNKRVVWRCLAAHDQWEQTLISFDLSYHKDTQQVVVDFIHQGWQDATPLFSLCSTKWAVFLLSLKQLIEEGKGSPYPEDIHINHFE